VGAVELSFNESTRDEDCRRSGGRYIGGGGGSESSGFDIVLSTLGEAESDSSTEIRVFISFNKWLTFG
jgi:hypothetical protein